MRTQNQDRTTVKYPCRTVWTHQNCSTLHSQGLFGCHSEGRSVQNPTTVFFKVEPWCDVKNPWSASEPLKNSKISPEYEGTGTRWKERFITIKTSAKVPLMGVIPEVGVAYTRLSFQVRYEPYSTPPQDLSPDTHLYTQPDGLWTFLDSFLIKKKTEQCSSYSYLYLYPITTHYLFILIKVCGVGYIATVLHCTLHFS